MQILVVDDNPTVRAEIQKMVEPFQHDVAWAANARDALDAIGRLQVDLLLVKQALPDANDLNLNGKVHELKLNHPVFVLLACARDNCRDNAEMLATGADDILAIPFSAAELQLKLSIAQRILHTKKELGEKLLAINRNYAQTIQALAQMLALYHPGTAEHCARVGSLCLDLAKRYAAAKPEEYPVIEAAGQLHDIGFTGLPVAMLQKRRTEFVGNESDLYRSHAERGEKILTQMDMMRPVARLVRSHHEQYNGRGFPDGLSGDQIPVGARIVAAASLYDDLVHREKAPLAKIPEILQQCRGYQLEPAMVALLIDINLNFQHQEARREDRDVCIEDLAEGMVLAREILMKSGAFLMAAGTTMNTFIIEKLKRYHQMGNISGKVFIRK